MSQSIVPTPITVARGGVLQRSIAVMKPVTWFAPAWAFLCGSIASNSVTWSLDNLGRVALGMLLAGPVLCGLSQVINEWFDRDVDAVNEPQRPIPSGRVSARQVFVTIAALSVIAIGLGLYLGAQVALLTGIGMILAVLYSVPPVRAKRNGWFGNTLVGFSYEGLPWIAGSVTFAALSWPSAAMAAMFSFGTIGIMAVNDFKSMAGDRQFGIRTLPVMYGAWGAAWLIILIMATAQLYVVVLFASWGNWIAAGVIVAALLGQLPLQRSFLRDPVANAIKFSAGASGLFVLGMLVAAIAV